MNRHGWRVIESVPSPDGDYCVDLFVDADGGYGWTHFRSDPEDAGGWTLMTRRAEAFASIEDARRDAAATFAWVAQPKT